MSPRGAMLLRSLQRTLQLVIEHEKASPAELEIIAVMLVAHIRAWRPLTLLQAGGM